MPTGKKNKIDKSLGSVGLVAKTESAKQRNSLAVVGIGASAGGLEAFEQFFRACSIDTGMAFVLVSHLDPDHVSLLTEILQRTTAMPVIEAVDQCFVEFNCVYVIPPNRDMAIVDRKLLLSVPNEPRGQRMPIDAFFRSLAEDQQENAIGIVLSGSGTDGTLGLRSILGSGGITLVQTPSSAKYESMPSSAIAAGYATHVLSPENMPDALLNDISRQLTVIPKTPVTIEFDSGINNILMQLRTTTGHDFSLYKKSTIGRRIERRMLQHNINDTEIYAHLLKENPAEVRQLFKELLINVTSFFRDSDAFLALKNEFLPQLIKDKPADYVFRVWIPGCASGEEAYSIAILLREIMDEMQQNFAIQIYSTDLDDEAITIARAGVYSLNIAQDVTPDRLQRFFVREESGYRIKKEIREMIVFAVQNVIKDPPFTRLDLLCCRNLMIYLEPELQNRLIPTFHYALKPEGILFLSPSESIGNHTDLFSSLNRKWKFYRAIPSIKLSRAVIVQGSSLASEMNGKSFEEFMKKSKETNFAELTRRVLVQYFAPASVVTDRQGDILYVHGDTGKYLRPAPGQASLNIVGMAREGLATALRIAIDTAINAGTPTLNRQLRVKSADGFVLVSLTVRPLPSSDNRQTLLLVCFQDMMNSAIKQTKEDSTEAAELSRVEELERDLAYLRETYQTTIEEQQASQEELKSTNEEMQSTNEELQSTNEALETSKEELQSVNEELIMVNVELQTKIEQLFGVQNDMKNLLENVNVGIILLDRHFCIRNFTREAMRIYRFSASDIGRPLNDIKSVVNETDLLIAAQTVLDTLLPFEQEICLNDKTWMLARIQPYRTLDNVIDGVLMTFTDITSRLKALEMQEALALAEGIVNTILEPLIVLDSALNVVSASRSFYETFQVMPNETIGHRIYELGNGQWNIEHLKQMLLNLWNSEDIFEEYVVEHCFPVISWQKMLLNARQFVGKTGESQLVLLSIEVVHE